MEVKNIDKYFSYDILRRGYDYYKKGKVKNIIKLKDGFIANVNGSEEYRVTILIDKSAKEITDLKCTCPYAEESNCKHMAAVLYCIKNNDMPTNKNKVIIRSEEITDFDKFKREYKKECYKLFHNRYYLDRNELEDYANIVNNFIKEGTKYIESNDEVAYQIFEFFLREIDEIDAYDEYGQKEDLFANVFESFQAIFNNEKLFANLLAFIEMIYVIDSNKYYFDHKANMINLLYQYINTKWQAEDTLVLLNKLDKNKDIYEFYKNNIRSKIVYLNYYFINKEKAISIANMYLNNNEICDFLLNISSSEEEKIAILKKIIFSEKNYSNEKYFEMLLSIYKDTDEEKYLDILKIYFDKYKELEIYHMIKECYYPKDWLRVKKQYLDMAKDSRIYFDICVEEEYYDELVEALQDEWIDIVNNYVDILKHHKPNELLQLYKNQILKELSGASDRKRYQRILSNFINFKRIPHGKDELTNIIKYIRENYKNRKALQEELDFFEETYL